VLLVADIAAEHARAVALALLDRVLEGAARPGADVLHLTYTAHEMAPFARDQGYDGPPFRWDEEDRLRRRARLDAVFFQLYGLDRAPRTTS
jgi:hypothetical protein